MSQEAEMKISKRMIENKQCGHCKQLFPRGLVSEVQHTEISGKNLKILWKGRKYVCVFCEYIFED